PDYHFLRFFPALLRVMMTEFLEVDGRFARTMRALLLHPGRLTRDFLSGRRYRYTPPLRLFLFSSLAVFLLPFLLASDLVSIEFGQDAEPPPVQVSVSSEQELERLKTVLADLPPEQQELFNLDQALVQGVELDSDFRDGNLYFFGDEPWDPVTNPIAVGWWPQALNDRLNAEAENMPQKMRQIGEDPALIVGEIFDLLPATMFIMLPLAALILKFWYSFAKRFYFEHLIFALHVHVFIFVCLIGLLLLEFVDGLAHGSDLIWLQKITPWLAIGVAIWLPLYLLLALKRVYGQGWLMTLFKAGAISTSYFTMLTIAFSLVLILGFILV
ncbi:MAG: DUF3667 domain-containing protein, partial [Xanthomonadales bacterium]|nr:DUF3667 domain-containing protein [Xanthomonadales bacterium]